MSSPDQNGLHQRTGYKEESGEYTEESGGYDDTDKGYSGPSQQAYQHSYGPSRYGTYQGQELGPFEYVDRDGLVRRRKSGFALACALALCWCVTWPCHGPCCGGF